MLACPTSSPKMTRMLGFLSAACAEAKVNTATNMLPANGTRPSFACFVSIILSFIADEFHPHESCKYRNLQRIPGDRLQYPFYSYPRLRARRIGPWGNHGYRTGP